VSGGGDATVGPDLSSGPDVSGGPDLSIGPHLSIGEVLEQLRDEFPDVTISKIRFLESQGLIDPERTPSGYRKFSDDDLERLRWILGQQRDHFLPLRIIRERLDAFGPTGAPPFDSTADAGPEIDPGAPRLPFEDAVDAADDDAEDLGAIAPDDSHPTGELTRAELLETTGISDVQLDALEDHGLVIPIVGGGERALYDEEALTVAGIAAGFHARGIEARHLKMYGHFADREGALFAQVLMPYLRQRNPMARERLQEELEDLARLGRRLRTEMLRRALRDELAE
jgi:DNA-binding transcriptional MerR regulator